MRLMIILFVVFVSISCNNHSNHINKIIPKAIHIPDTTNNWYVKLMDYDYYLRKKYLEEQLHLTKLETDTGNIQIRVWTLASNYNPQRVYLLKENNTNWTLSTIFFYVNFSNWNNPKIDSVSTYMGFNNKILTSEKITQLNLVQLWGLPSQGEMKNGSKFGCVDGYGLLIEMNNRAKYKYSFYMCPDFHISDDSIFKVVDSFSRNLY